MRTKPEESWPEHPLFPAEEGEEPHRVEFIQIVRYEQGRALLVPTTFRAGELTSLENINSTYGGGLYELIGRRCSIHDPTSMGRISAKVRYEIAGPSRPLVVDPNAPPPTAPAAPTSFQPVAAQTPDTSVMGMFMQMQMQMFTAAQENNRQQAEAQRRADDRARDDSRQMMQMIATIQAQSTQSMMGVLTAVIGKTGGGGVDEIAKMAGLLKDLGVVGAKGDGDGETESIGGIISNVADIVAGAVELKQGLPSGGGPPGSAAAVLGAVPSRENAA